MRRITLISVSLALALLFCFWQFQHKTCPVLAQSLGYTEADLAGVWIGQWTGNVVLPKGMPLEVLNGPWATTEKVVLDGAGGGTGSGIACFNGLVVRVNSIGSYTVARDGRVKLVAAGEAPGVGKIGLELEGYICDGGNEMRLIATKSLAPGLPEGFAGMVATGVYKRQR